MEGHHVAIADSGKIKTKLQSQTDYSHVIGVPTGVTLRFRRPYQAKLRRRVVTVGRHSPGSIYDDSVDNAWKLGIQKPSAAPTVAAAGTGITGIVIIYYNWRHWEGATLVHQGNISPASSTLNLTNQGVNITLPATAPDARTTHVGIWASVDGDIPKWVSDVTIGTTAASWTGPVSGRGDTIPVNSDGTINTDARGVPPVATYLRAYHKRLWYNSFDNPERTYYSLIDEPESVGPLAFIPTLGREAVVGYGEQGDELCVLCANVFYSVQGYSGGGANPDFVMRLVDDAVGTCSHGSIAKVYGQLHFADARGGVYRYPGGGAKPVPLMQETHKTFWRAQYQANRAAYEDSQGYFDTDRQAYRLLIPGAPAFYYVGSYAASERGGMPEWGPDDRARNDYCVGSLWDPLSQQSFHCVGSTDGYIRQENYRTNADDDGDALAKRLIIRTRHAFQGTQYGGRVHGGSCKEIMLYMKCEAQGFTVAGYGGDDPARDALLPTWGPYNLAALAATGAVAETSKLIRPTKLSGKGFTIEITVTAPLGFEWRGHSISRVTGPQFRGRTV